MNENIDLTKILKDCPKGMKLYSTIFGDVKFNYINKSYDYPINFYSEGGYNGNVSADGRYNLKLDGECTLFPSKEQRDWNKFNAPWYKKEKFDPKTLKPFDKVLVRNTVNNKWECELFSHIIENKWHPYRCFKTIYTWCIPYNKETEHLVGTYNEAPDFYKYWED